MASKERTQQQRERAAEQVRERRKVSALDPNRENKFGVCNDLQCELNEARELLEAYSEVGITIRDEQVMAWLSRNK